MRYLILLSGLMLAPLVQPSLARADTPAIAVNPTAQPQPYRVHASHEPSKPKLPIHTTIEFAMELDLLDGSRPSPFGGELGLNRGDWEMRVGMAASLDNDDTGADSRFYRGLFRWYGASASFRHLANRDRKIKIVMAFLEGGMGVETRSLGSDHLARIEGIIGTGVAAQTPYGLRLTLGLRHRFAPTSDIDQAWTGPDEPVSQTTSMYFGVGLSY